MKNAAAILQARQRAEEALLEANKALEAKTAELAAALAERKILLERERAARAEAERLNLMKDEFLAILSHELRTPLNAILGWTQLLKRGGRTEGDVRRGLDTIERNARAQARLVEELLDMSRITSGTIALDRVEVPVGEVVLGVLEAFRPTADTKGILLSTDPGVMDGVVIADAARLQQIVWNLVSNAVKFTPAGGSVVVSVRRTGGAVELRVTDTGRGIPSAFLPFVFERFRQEDSSTTRTFGGLGLGLAIVKELAELHGGRVAAESGGEGAGSSFIVTLPDPLTEATIAELPSSTPLVREPSPQRHNVLGGDKILIVEDDPDSAAMMRMVLEAHGARVLIATSGPQALEMVGRERPSLLVSDIGLPLMDGYEFMQRVRATSPTEGGSTPAIAVTAFARTEDRELALAAGYDRHLSKPVDVGELLEEVRRALRKNV
jgi:signal transduction histidine kinase/ActR/RegA family two-component response regulator